MRQSGKFAFFSILEKRETKKYKHGKKKVVTVKVGIVQSDGWVIVWGRP